MNLAFFYSEKLLNSASVLDLHFFLKNLSSARTISASFYRFAGV